MSQLKELLDQEASRVDADPGALESVPRRRDRKGRNQRVTAGVVGIAVFLLTIWIVSSANSLDRTDSSVVPAGSGTGSVQTGPTESPDATWDGSSIPPEGTDLSTPLEGDLVKRYPGYNAFTYVYADGRVIWYEQGASRILGEGQALERRLTPEGVDLVRSGAQLDEIPDSAWADAEPRVYAPARYVICLWSGHGDFDPSAAMDLLPAPAQAMLRGIRTDPDECTVLTTEDARALDEMLSEAGLVPASAHRGISASAWYVDGDHDPRLSIWALLPHGSMMGLRG